MRSRLVLAVAIVFAATANAQQGVSYRARGKDIHFPLGNLSFVDELVLFTPGDPPAPADVSHPKDVLGPPDYGQGVKGGALSLGCGGTVVYRFTDNALVDIPGPDLYVFEVGPAVEPTNLAISGDGQTWVGIGKIAGATAEIDIAKSVRPTDTFSYVRLTDERSACSGRTPGADIDAVGAIGGARRVVLDTAVLFDFNESSLKPEARAVLLNLAKEIAGARMTRVVVEGHTDDVGSEPYNQQLSSARATAVRSFLVREGRLTARDVLTVGYGETRPAVPNDTEEHRAANRRVEVLIVAR